MKAWRLFVMVAVSSALIIGCSMDSGISPALDRIQEVDWSKIISSMTPVSKGTESIISKIQAALNEVKTYRSQGLWRVRQENNLGWDSIELWATFVKPDKTKLRYHSVLEDTWDEQVFLGNRSFMHLNRISENATNKVKEYKEAYVLIEDKTFSKIVDDIAHSMSLEKNVDLFQSSNRQGLEMWENQASYVISFIVMDWEAFVNTGKRTYVIWMTIDKKTLHPQQLKIQAASDGEVARDFFQSFFDYDSELSIEEPRPEQILNAK